MSLYLGLDCSTQSLSAIVLEVDAGRKRIVFESSLDFDSELPEYGTCHGVLPNPNPAVVVTPPVMWADALDRMMARVARSGLDVRRLAAVSGSAQQHGSVYVKAGSADLAALDPGRPLGGQVAPLLARAVAPTWMDSSTSVECAEITRAVGGGSALAARTGSRAFERFTAAQIRKFFKADMPAYGRTNRIHLVSSFLASLLAGRHAAMDPGDGSGTNLMDLRSQTPWNTALDAVAPDLSTRLTSIEPPSSIVGPLSAYWQERYGFPAAKAVIWSGDNPSSLVGIGLVEEGRVGISLGTSDTIFGVMEEPRVDAGGTGHVFGAPTGAYMGLTCFKNGSLARERIRDAHHLTWQSFAGALAETPPGNHGRMMLPWFEPEITPAVAVPGVRRFDLDEADVAANVRAVVEAQQMAMAIHSRWMAVDIRTIHATGGAAENRAILQVMADVFGADVYQFEIANSAALGAALRAYHADRLAEGELIPWQAIVAEIVEPTAAGKIAPDPRAHRVYQDLMRRYEDRERGALRAG